jgi:recombinational DNA repair protein (RecF pathway)
MCSVCGEEKPIYDFYRDHRNVCKDCVHEREVNRKAKRERKNNGGSH